jgi:hypothetical protein
MSTPFPIQPFRDYSHPIEGRKKVKNEPLSIPWELIAPHEAQAQRNHSQTLKRLAERGGLSACEAVAVLEDRPWEKMDPQAAADRLRALLTEKA